VTKESADEWMLYLTTRRDSNSGSNVVERRGSMETKADGEVQSKDLAFAAAVSIDDCSNCCCIQRMTVSGVQKQSKSKGDVHLLHKKLSDIRF
jgi:hypothetical protein